MIDFAALEGRVRSARYGYERRAGAARQLGEDGMRCQAEVARLTAETDCHAKAAALLNSLGEQAQQQAQDKLERLVTSGLQVIFGNELSFHVKQSVKANQAVMEFMIRSTYEGNFVVETPVMEARGGGMVGVTGFMIRLVVLLLTPKARRVMFLDETFGFLSREFEPRLAEFLAEVARRAGVQVVLATHSDAYDDAADMRYHTKPDGRGATSITA